MLTSVNCDIFLSVTVPIVTGNRSSTVLAISYSIKVRELIVSLWLEKGY